MQIKNNNSSQNHKMNYSSFKLRHFFFLNGLSYQDVLFKNSKSILRVIRMYVLDLRDV